MNNLVFNYQSMANNLNDYVYSDYFIRLMLISRSIFEWSGLPDGMDEKWIEKYLFSRGKCLFFKDPLRGYMVTELAPESRYNIYNEPIIVRPYAIDYTGESLTNYKDCVVIKNNDLCIPTTNTTQLYAYKLASIDRTIDINIQAQKTPIIIECTEKEYYSMKNFMNKRNDNEPQIFVSDKTNLNGVKVHDLKAPPVFKDLELQKHMIWNEYMTFLGLNNANQDKRERLVADEVQANNEQVEACFNAMFSERQRACEMINRVFPELNVSVKKRIQNMPLLSDSEGSEPTEDERGDDNE